MNAAREDCFGPEPNNDLDRLIFFDETAVPTKIACRYGRARCGERCRIAVPHSMCGRPFGCKQNLWTGAARDRVLPCVRPLMRRVTCREPVWECESRDHITTVRSKRSPCAWFPQLRFKDVAPYLSVDLLTPSDSLAAVLPTR